LAITCGEKGGKNYAKMAGSKRGGKAFPPKVWTSASIQFKSKYSNQFIHRREREKRGKWFIYPTIAAVVGGVDSSGAHSTTYERSDTDCIIIWIGATGAFACALIRLLD